MIFHYHQHKKLQRNVKTKNYKVLENKSMESINTIKKYQNIINEFKNNSIDMYTQIESLQTQLNKISIKNKYINQIETFKGKIIMKRVDI